MDAYQRISVEKAHEIMGAEKVTVVDIRDTHSFSQGHISQALAVNDENMEEFLKVTDKEIPLICYCYHGISSQRAAGFFASKGFKQTYSIDGGWEAWKAIYG